MPYIKIEELPGNRAVAEIEGSIVEQVNLLFNIADRSSDFGGVLVTAAAVYLKMRDANFSKVDTLTADHVQSIVDQIRKDRADRKNRN